MQFYGYTALKYDSREERADSVDGTARTHLARGSIENSCVHGFNASHCRSIARVADWSKTASFHWLARIRIWRRIRHQQKRGDFVRY